MNETLGVVLAIAAGILILALLFYLFAQKPTRQRPRRTTAEAFHLLLEGDRAGARAILTDVVRNGDGPVEATLRLGDLLREEDEFERALRLHQGLLARADLDADHRRLAESAVADDLLAMGKAPEALARLEALDKKFIDPNLMSRHALALHRCGRFDAAAERWIARAREAKGEANGEAAAYLAERARVLLHEDKLAEALRTARRALALDEACGVALVVEGEALMQQGKSGDAVTAWLKGLASDASAADQLLPRLLEAARQGGKVDSLVETLEMLRDENPEHPTLWRAVADLRLRRGDHESFFALLDDPPAGATDSLPAWAGWIRLLAAREDRRPMEDLLQRLPSALATRSWVCIGCGHAEAEPRSACMNCGAPEALVGGA